MPNRALKDSIERHGMKLQGRAIRLSAVAGIALAATMLTACSGKPDKAEVRYRVTVIADEHGVERRGSAVWSQSLSRPLLPLASAYDPEFRGDAIPLRLSNGGVLFVLLQS